MCSGSVRLTPVNLCKVRVIHHQSLKKRLGRCRIELKSGNISSPGNKSKSPGSTLDVDDFPRSPVGYVSYPGV